MASKVDLPPNLLPSVDRRMSSNEDILDNEFAVGTDEVTTQEAIETLEKLRRKTRNSIAQHRIASKHFSSRQFSWFFMPQVILGLIASILSFLADSSLLTLRETDENGNDNGPGAGIIMTTVVGVISLIVVAMQTISREKQFGERGVMHTIASENFHHLEIELDNFLSLFSVESKKKENRKRTLENGKKVLLRYQRRFREVEVGCKSPIPIALANAFILLESNIDSSVFKVIKAKYHQESDEFHKFATQTLCQEVCGHPLYPLLLPRADMMVHNATKRVISRLQEMDEQEVNFMKISLGLEKVRTEQNILNQLQCFDVEQLKGSQGNPEALQKILRKIRESRENQKQESRWTKKLTVSQAIRQPRVPFYDIVDNDNSDIEEIDFESQGAFNTMRKNDSGAMDGDEKQQVEERRIDDQKEDENGETRAEEV